MQHAAAASAVLAAAGQNNANTGYVSSTTHMNGYNLPNRPLNGQPNAGKTDFQQLGEPTVVLETDFYPWWAPGIAIGGCYVGYIGPCDSDKKERL